VHNPPPAIPHALRHLSRPRWSTILLVVVVAMVLGITGLGLVVIGATRRADRLADAPAPVAPPQAHEQVVPESQPGPEPDAVASHTQSPAPAGGLDQPWPVAAGGQPPVEPSNTGQLPNSFASALQRYSPHLAPALPRVVPAVPASALGFAWPLYGVLTSTFGDEHPLGVDIAPYESTALVLAARDGRVVVAGGDPCCGYGYLVILDHGDGLTSVYGHLHEAPHVQPGEWVERGTVLGVAGNTGHSFGIHLHFEVRVSGVPVDPEAVLTAGHLVPLARAERPVPSPSADPAAPATPRTAEPVVTEEQFTPASTPPVGLTPSPVATPTSSTTPSLSAMPTPSVTPTPSATPAAVAANARPTPTASAAPTPTPTVRPSPTPSPTPVATATPAPTSSAASMPAARPTPSPTAKPAESPAPLPPTPTPTPACATLRLDDGVRRAAPAPSDGLVTLELESGAVRSLVAERCGADAPIIVTGRPMDGDRCGAMLHDNAGALVRRLIPVRPPDGDVAVSPSGSEVRWQVGAEILPPDGGILRVTCRPYAPAEGE
jgi:murein DD-endopeptidase MepM/ murein hydrolase activator NlpD